MSEMSSKGGRVVSAALPGRGDHGLGPGGVEHPWFARGASMLAVPLLLLALVGVLSRQPTPGSAVSTAPAGPPAAAAAPAPEQVYLEVAQAHGVTDPAPAVISTARNACADLTAGGNVLHVAHYAAVRHGLDDADARVVLRAAVAAYCPVHESEVVARPAR